jgi:PD-(D/E)XK nuclease superfamily
MPERQIVLMRNSERSTYRRCRLKWDWSYNRRLAPQRVRGALTFGTLVHVALATYYPPGVKRGPAPAETFEKLYAAQKRDFDQWDEEGNRFDALELGVSMLEGYVKEYGDDDDIEIIAPEIPLAVDVYDRLGNYLCTWAGRGDAAYRDRSASSRSRQRIGLLEHKTAKSIEEELRVNSGYGEQGLSYWWGSSIVFQEQGLINHQIDHVKFNWLKKIMDDERPRNANGHALNKPSKDALLDACVAHQLVIPRRAKVEDLLTVLRAAGINTDRLGEISKVQPKPRFHRFNLDFGDKEKEMVNWRIRAEAYEMAQVRAGKLPIYKNPTKDCSWDCQFKEACEIHEMGGDWESVLELEFEEWSPYADHELLEEKG